MLEARIMNQIETNIFPILNLGDLKAIYKIYRIRGLTPDQEEYDHNIQTLIYRLSSHLHSPVTVIFQENHPFLAIPDNARDPPTPFQLVRTTVHFEPTDKTILLDYQNPSPETEHICLRFLQSHIENTLRKNPRFWQPSAGQPIYEREPMEVKENINVYRGFAFRIVSIDDGKFGLCVDVTFRYVSSVPLSLNLTRDDFRRCKGTRYIYHFGHDWYEITPQEYPNLTITEQLIDTGEGKTIPLYEYIKQKAPQPFSKDVANLSPTSMALRYFTLRGDARHAPSSLCYQVYGTNDPRIQKLHPDTILPPLKRRQMIHVFVKENLGKIRTDTMDICVSINPLKAEKNIFPLPDFKFGNNTILSVRGTPNAIGVDIYSIGKERLSALRDKRIGPYTRKPLDQQYFILPQSVLDSYGQAFISDLKKEVNALFPQENPYDPTIISYNDHVPRTFSAQGKSILEAINVANLKPGYGVIMIHEIQRRIRQQDQLASMLMHKLRKQDLFMSIIHTTRPSLCYHCVQTDPSGAVYTSIKEQQGRLSGYLRNVAINKVLLTNERWPFVLSTPLNADLTIAIDVKNHTACFTFMGKSESDIRTDISVSGEKEKLNKVHVKKVISGVLHDDPTIPMKGITTIMIQRDGRIYPTEMNGIKETINDLKKEGILPNFKQINFVEIHKKSLIPFRIFDVEMRPGGLENIQNPQIGTFIILNSHDGYICSTGREFKHPGTTKPLHIKNVEGDVQFSKSLEDIYSLTSLTLTRPEDCSRLPFTLKLTDIRLSEHAGEYDEDALVYNENENEIAPSTEDEGASE